MTTMLLKSMDDMMNMHCDMDRIFEAFCVPPRSRALRRDASAGRAYHLHEDADNVYAELVIPGVAPGDIEVTVEDGLLKVTGQRPETSGGDEVLRWRLNERETGRFSQSFRLPAEIERDKVAAEYTHGILTVTLPKTPEAKPRKIAVRQG